MLTRTTTILSNAGLGAGSRAADDGVVADETTRRVALLCTRFNDAGGAEIDARRLATGLRERGHQVRAWYLYLERQADTVEDWMTVFLPHAPRGPIDVVRVIRRLIAEMRSFRPDAIMGFHPLANVLGCAVAALVGTPRRFASQRNPATSQRPAMKLLDRLAGSLSVYSGNIAVSRSVAASFADYPASYREKLQVIINGVPELPPVPRESCRELFSLPAGVPLIGTVGRHSRQKNHEFLVRLLRELPDVHLAIVGDGELRGELLALAHNLQVTDRLHLLGLHPWERVARFLRALDVFVFPSRYEGFGIALVEALQAELPVVANDLDVFREILQPTPGQFAGVLIPTEREAEWGREIRRLLDDPAARATLIDAARPVRYAYSLDAMINAHEIALVRGR